jgi:hypothetical protein
MPKSFMRWIEHDPWMRPLTVTHPRATVSPVSGEDSRPKETATMTTTTIRSRIDESAPESFAWVGGSSPYAVPLAKRRVVYEVMLERTPVATSLSTLGAFAAQRAIQEQAAR